MKKSIFKTFAVVLTVAMLVAFSSITAFAGFGEGDFFNVYSSIPNEENDGFWFDVEGLIDETTGEPVVDGGSMRGHPYIDYLRDHGTPKNIEGGDHSPFFGVEGEEDDTNTFVNLNPGSYYVADHPFEESYHATVDIKLDDMFAAGTFAAIRFNVDNDDGATLIGSTAIGLNIAFDVADSSKDTISIGVDGGYYTVDLPDGDLANWKTIEILDNNEGIMKIYYENQLFATVELSGATGGEYKTVVVKDATGAEKVNKTDASVSANYNNMNFGVAQNAEKTNVPEGGLHIDNWGIVPYEFDATKNDPKAEAPSDPTEAPSAPTETPADKTETPADKTEAPAEKTDAPAKNTKAPAANEAEDEGGIPTTLIIVIVVAVVVVAAVVVVIILKKKKA